MFFQIIVLFGVVLFYFLITVKKPKDFPPGPPRLPYVGSLPFVLKYETLALRMQALADKWGDVMGFYVGNSPTVMLSNLDAIKQVYKMEEASYRPPSRAHHYMRYADKNGVGTKGILHSSGELWKEQRRFTLKNLRDLGFGKTSMEDVIKGEANKLCNTLQNMNGSPTELDYKLNVAILNALWMIIVGEELNPDNPLHKEAIKGLNTLIRGEGNLNNNPLFQMFPFLLTIFGRKRFKAALKTIEDMRSVFRPYRKQHRETIDTTSPRDFLDVHIRAQLESTPKSSFHGKDGEQNEEITMLDLFIAGAETTSTTIAWGILYLLHHPEVQENIHKEMDSVLQNREPSLQDEKDLPYFSSVLHEIHRCASIVHVGVPHYTTQQITVQRYTIPKGATVYANISKVMHNPEVFKNPDRFNPERFLDSEGKFQSSHHVIPFLTGKRMCLGSSLADKELYLFMGQLLHRFKFSPGALLPSYSIHSRKETSNTLIRFPPKYKLKTQNRL